MILMGAVIVNLGPHQIGTRDQSRQKLSQTL
jgi:hypothetical protein